MRNSKPNSYEAQALAKAKRLLRDRGWTYRDACRDFGGPLPVTFSHLSKVLSGDRDSRRLLAAIATLPAREKRPS